MIKEFREFINRGNVVDLAVAVILGAAFTAIVNSLVADIITPLIGVLLGGVNLAGLSISIGDAVITYGNFIQAILDFLIIAFVVFLIVRQINTMHKKEEEALAPSAPSELDLLTEIRDLLKK